jgi:replicative DNA helicase
MAAQGITHTVVAQSLGHKMWRSTVYAQNLSRERASRVAIAVGSRELAALAQSDVYWDEVMSVKPDGETEVYDLTVDGLHNFVASDMTAHNSIEQDSDVVIFLYRDKAYNPDTEKEHVADLIVAKHRNGPTGQIALFFNETQTRFVDLAPASAAGV